MTNPRGTVSPEVHRGPITKGCGMTQNHRTQGDVERFVDPFDAYGVTGLNDDLPERADMPRIMDERDAATDSVARTITMPTAKCGRTERHTAHRYGMREQDWCAGNVDAITEQRDGSQVTR